MQIIAVLRGCLAAYLSGVVLVSTSFLLWALYRGQVDGLVASGQLMLIAVFGGLFALAIGAVVVLAWVVLAWRRSTVPNWAAPGLGSVFGGAPFVIASEPAWAFAYGALIGAACGAAFWVAAFGWRRSVRLHLGRDSWVNPAS